MFLKRNYRDRALGILGAFGLLAVALVVNGAHERVVKPVHTADAVHAVNLVQKGEPGRDHVC